MDAPPNSLPALSATLHEALETAGLASPDISISHITTLLQRYTAPDYHPFAHHDPSKPYTRTLLDDGNGFFNLMLLVWTPGAGSPVHDHAGSHCLMKVLDGELAETLYAVPDAHDHPTHDERVDSGNEDSVDEGEPKGIRVRKNARLAVGDVAYIHDKIGLHKISNPSPSQHAVSLHLYTPPFEYCKTYCERTGEARASGKCVFYKDFSSRAAAAAGTQSAMTACRQVNVMRPPSPSQDILASSCAKEMRVTLAAGSAVASGI